MVDIEKAFFSQSFGNAKDMKKKDKKKGDFDYIRKLKKKQNATSTRSLAIELENVQTKSRRWNQRTRVKRIPS